MASSKKINASIVLGGTITGALKGALGSAQDGLKKIGTEIGNLTRRQRLLADSMKIVHAQGRNVGHMQAEYAAITREVDRLRTAQGRLARASAARQANLNKRAQYRGQLGEAFAIGAAVTLPVAKTIKDAAAFDKEMTLIGNTADMTTAQASELGRTIVEVSSRVGQSAQTVQKAAGFLIAAGLDAKRATESIETIGRTATASGADIEDLSKAAFTLMDALKVSPTDLQKGLDILAQAGKEGNVELKDMARTLPALGSSFVALKMQGNEAVATLGAALEIARKGAADPDEAANNMRNFLAKVLSPETLKKAKKNFNLDLNKIIKDAQKSGSNPFEAAVAAIMKATQGDQKKLGDLFQDMQVQNFLRPLMQNWGEYQRIKGKALGATGVTDRDLAKVTSTAKQQMDRLGQSVGRLSIALGHALTPGVGSAADKLANLVDRMADFTEKNPRLVGAVVKTVAAFAALRLAGVVLGYTMTWIKAPFLLFMEVLAGVRASAAVTATSTTLLGKAFRFLGTTIRWVGLTILANPIFLIGAAIAGLVYEIYKHWGGVKDFFSRLWNDVTTMFKGWWNVIAGIFTLDFPRALDGLKQVFSGFGNYTADLFGGIASGIKNVVRDILSALGIVEEKKEEVTLGKVVAEQNKMASFWEKSAAGVTVQKVTSDELASKWESDASNVMVPSMATDRRASTPPPVTQNITQNITQQPGEDADAFARRVAREMQKQQGVSSRGALVDGAQH
ncbi:phage tail tape measure protein [Bradyrhizobium sp. 613_E4_N2_2]|uniref:phage tail tape measure protein n=1 Tax=Bradyrhizobium sp. 613_E4_N2_2 TaxID=3240371 RepID=UPI003F8B7ECE